MQAITDARPARYAKCIEVSKRIRWDIDRDVIRARAVRFRPQVPARRAVARSSAPVPGRRANDACCRRCRAAPTRTCSGWSSASSARRCSSSVGTTGSATRSRSKAIVRFTDEELKHQELFRRIEALIAAEGMPDGLPLPAAARRRRGLRARQVHLGGARADLPYRARSPRRITARASSRRPSLSPLFKDIFFFHWREESQHAIIDELEWKREHAKLDCRGARRGRRRPDRPGRRASTASCRCRPGRRRLLSCAMRGGTFTSANRRDAASR